MARLTSTHRALNRSLGKALHRYNMIGDGDRILIGLSGGKDSMTLLWMLNERLSRIPIKYELFAAYIDPGFNESYAHELKSQCADMGFHLSITYTDIGPLSHSRENRENPCFLCSRLRRRRLFEIAKELGCSKIALGHNKDDLIETMFINMCYGGVISTMLPVQEFFNGEYSIIRPLACTDEGAILKFARKSGFPIFQNSCPSASNSKRSEIKKMLETLYTANQKVKGNLFRSMHNVRYDYLPK